MLLGFAAITPAMIAADADPVSSTWNEHVRLDFSVAGRPCWVVLPREPAAGKPWIWRTEFFGHEPQADIALLKRGWHVAYLNVKNMYGAPRSIELMRRFHDDVVARFGLARRVVLEGFSRGGLYAFNYAATHPDRVAALYLDAPVLDIRSWPLRKAGEKERRECLAAYGLTEDSLAAFRGNPLDRVEVVAKGKIPIIAVCGDADQTVPFAENTALLEKRYRELAGEIQVIVKPGVDHHPHSLKDPTPVVEFLVKNARF